MELWVPFFFGVGVGALLGYLFGRRRRPAATPAPRPTPRASGGSGELRRVVVDEGAANVLNALNNRLSAIGGLADLLRESGLDEERQRALLLLHSEVRRAAEITQHSAR